MTTGQLQRVALEQAIDTQHLRRGVDLFQNLGLAHPGLTQRRGDVLEHRQGRVIDELLVDHRHVALAHRDIGHIGAIHQYASAARLIQAGHQAHQAGLARQRAPQQHIEGARFEAQADIVDMQLVINDPRDMLQGK